MKTYTQLNEELGLGESNRARKALTRKKGQYVFGTQRNPISTGKLLDEPRPGSPTAGNKDSVFNKMDKATVGQSTPQAQKVYGIRQGDKEHVMNFEPPIGRQVIRPGYNPKNPLEVKAAKLRGTNTPEQEMGPVKHIQQIGTAARLKKHLLQQQLKAKKNK